MQKLKSIFIIYIFFIIISSIIGVGVFFISEKYSSFIFGTLLVLSSLVILFIFIKAFVFNTKDSHDGEES